MGKEIQVRQLPKIQDLYTDLEKSIQYNDLNILLNCQPKPEWVKQHPAIKVKGLDENGRTVDVPLKYLPIGTVEYLLTSIFIKWRFEIKEVKLIANSVVTVGRLHVLDPVTGEWDWQDGEGAIPLQTDKDKGAIDFNYLKNNAVTLAAPASESEAIKDAAHKFGKIFGKDLNRRDEMNYSALTNKFVKTVNFDDKKAELSGLLRTTKKKIIVLEDMGGIDIQTLKNMCQTKEEAGELNEKFVDEILNSLKDGK